MTATATSARVDGDANVDALTSSLDALSVEAAAGAAALPPASRPCAVCGAALPAEWGRAEAMSFFFSRLRAADAADVRAKERFWGAAMRAAQRHAMHSAAPTPTPTPTPIPNPHPTPTPTLTTTTTAAQPPPRLSFTLADMQRRFTRVRSRERKYAHQWLPHRRSSSRAKRPLTSIAAASVLRPP